MTVIRRTEQLLMYGDLYGDFDQSLFFTIGGTTKVKFDAVAHPGEIGKLTEIDQATSSFTVTFPSGRTIREDYHGGNVEE